MPDICDALNKMAEDAVRGRYADFYQTVCQKDSHSEELFVLIYAYSITPSDDILKRMVDLGVCACSNCGSNFQVVHSSTVPIIQIFNKLLLACNDEQEEDDDPVIPPPVPLRGYWGWQSTDPYAGLLAGEDTLIYVQNKVVTSAPVAVDFRSAPQAQYLFYKEPSTLPIRSNWTNSSFNFGVIPDQVFRAAFILEGYRYYVTRTSVDFSTLNLTTFS